MADAGNRISCVRALIHICRAGYRVKAKKRKRGVITRRKGRVTLRSFEKRRRREKGERTKADSGRSAH